MNIVKKHYGNIACNPQVMEIEGFDLLASLALDMRWSWDHTADELWQQLDPALWEQSHNPWLILQSVSGDQLQRQLLSPSFRAKLVFFFKQKTAYDITV